MHLARLVLQRARFSKSSEPNVPSLQTVHVVVWAVREQRTAAVRMRKITGRVLLTTALLLLVTLGFVYPSRQLHFLALSRLREVCVSNDDTA